MLHTVHFVSDTKLRGIIFFFSSPPPSQKTVERAKAIAKSIESTTMALKEFSFTSNKLIVSFSFMNNNNITRLTYFTAQLIALFGGSKIILVAAQGPPRRLKTTLEDLFDTSTLERGEFKGRDGRKPKPPIGHKLHSI